jgi:hypothetical protein
VSTHPILNDTSNLIAVCIHHHDMGVTGYPDLWQFDPFRGGTGCSKSLLPLFDWRDRLGLYRIVGQEITP